MDERIVELLTDGQLDTAEVSIVGLRNQIIHAYDGISDEVIWGVIVNHLPGLKMEVAKLLI